VTYKVSELQYGRLML